MSEWKQERDEAGRAELITRPWASLLPVVIVLLGMVIVAAAVWLNGWISRQVEVDSCLDSGGRYLYAKEECDFGKDRDPAEK